MNIWFTTDTHYRHKRIIELANRPFGSVEEMEEVMIERHTSSECKKLARSIERAGWQSDDEPEKFWVVSSRRHAQPLLCRLPDYADQCRRTTFRGGDRRYNVGIIRSS